MTLTLLPDGTLPWKVDVVINIALVGLALWVRRRPRPRRALGTLGFVYGALFVLSSLAGIAVAVFIALDPFAGETLDTSHGAVALMEISCAATGAMAFLLPTIAAAVMYCRSPVDAAQSR